MIKLIYMQSIKGVRTVIYKVGNMATAKRWYAEAFEVQPYFDEPYYVGFSIGGYELGLQPDETAAGDNVIAYWGVDDIEAQYKRLLDIGATAHEAPQNVGGNIMVASVKDGWGNIIGLIYNPEFKIEHAI
jgi:predicted enzyme related to lactoylglutathione lyase